MFDAGRPVRVEIGSSTELESIKKYLKLNHQWGVRQYQEWTSIGHELIARVKPESSVGRGSTTRVKFHLSIGCGSTTRVEFHLSIRRGSTTRVELPLSIERESKAKEWSLSLI